MIYAFGDSHSREARLVDGVTVAFAGPITLHRFGQPGEAARLFGPRPDVEGIFLLFGEIDVRCHIGRQVEDEGRNELEVIRALVQGARRGVWDLIAMAQNNPRPRPVVFCAVTPPSIAHETSPEFPIRGDLEDRIRWTQLLNYALSVSVPFYDPYDNFRQLGTLPPTYSDGSVHLDERFGKEVFTTLVERMVLV